LPRDGAIAIEGSAANVTGETISATAVITLGPLPGTCLISWQAIRIMRAILNWHRQALVCQRDSELVHADLVDHLGGKRVDITACTVITMTPIVGIVTHVTD
jgi:hypothetical protein